MSSNEAVIEHATQEISAALNETQLGAIQQIKRVVRLQGVAWAQALQAEVAQIEAQDGMPRPDGQRRTPGGAFLYLAYQRMKVLRGQPLDGDLRQHTRDPIATASHTDEPLARRKMNVSTPRPPTVSMQEPTDVSPPTPPLAPTLYSPKQRVRHANFGAGEVVRTESIDGVEKVTVDFDTAGLKRVAAATLEPKADG